MLTKHPGPKVFSLSKNKLAHTGLNQLAPPKIFLQSDKMDALSIFIKGHLIDVITQLKTTTPCSITHESMYSEIMCLFCTQQE